MAALKVAIFIFGLLGVGAYLAPRFKQETDESGKVGVPATPIISIFYGVGFLLILLAFLSAIHIIPAGHRGIVFSQVTGIKGYKLDEGFNIVTPLVDRVIVFDVRIQKEDAVGAASSKDLQNVKVEVLTNYHADAKTVNLLYQRIGTMEMVKSKIIEPGVQESVKAVSAEFTAAEIIQKRAKVKQRTFDLLAKRFKKYHLVLTDISLVNIEFDPQYTQAIEDKVRQAQIALKEEVIVEQKKQIAQQRIEEARGDKESRILRAQGVAEANTLLERSLTSNVLRQRWIYKWNGELPTYLAGNEAENIIQIPPPE